MENKISPYAQYLCGIITEAQYREAEDKSLYYQTAKSPERTPPDSPYHKDGMSLFKRQTLDRMWQHIVDQIKSGDATLRDFEGYMRFHAPEMLDDYKKMMRYLGEKYGHDLDLSHRLS